VAVRSPNNYPIKLPIGVTLATTALRKGGDIMPIIICLYKLTDQGVKNIKETPQQIEENIKGFEAVGGKVLGVYSVMGEYDFVAIGETPSDEVAMTFALAVGSAGDVRTTTLKAFTKEEFSEIVKKLP